MTTRNFEDTEGYECPCKKKMAFGGMNYIGTSRVNANSVKPIITDDKVLMSNGIGNALMQLSKEKPKPPSRVNQAPSLRLEDMNRNKLVSEIMAESYEEGDSTSSDNDGSASVEDTAVVDSGSNSSWWDNTSTGEKAIIIIAIIILIALVLAPMGFLSFFGRRKYRGGTYYEKSMIA